MAKVGGLTNRGLNMTLTTRPAKARDASEMAALLNAVISAGGTTAHGRPFTPDRMLHHYIQPDELVSCTVAERSGEIVGFQSLAWPRQEGDPFPDGWAIIATFAKIGQTGGGIGKALFEVTRTAADRAGVRTIDATIRADNVGGLRYYSRIGFTDYDRLINVPLSDGTKVDRIRKRFDLK